jgi:nucleoid DNA-binding protein
MDQRIKKLINELSIKHGISIAEGELIYNTQFELVRNVLSMADRENLIYHNVRLMGFGVFHYKEGMGRKIREKIELKKQKL